MITRQVVVITGSRRGIGAATAKRFTENGYAVCLNDMSNATATANAAAAAGTASRAGCVIINVSSAAARSGSPHEYIDYAASNSAIDTLTKGLSLKSPQKTLG
jgi:NAD(P)-dependent dehydrogenase (short-subunit alcohol dehydrogenase family)